LPIASGDGDTRFPIQIHADVHVYATLLPRGESLSFEVQPGRQAYLVAIEGDAVINDAALLEERDGMEIVEETIRLEADATAHLIILEMAKP
jgi:redox-sensitive bicupin YhaK (pirin superfamily)